MYPGYAKRLHDVISGSCLVRQRKRNTFTRVRFFFFQRKTAILPFIDPLHGYLRIGRPPAPHVRGDSIDFWLHAMINVEIASGSWGDVGYLYTLLQCREYILRGQKTVLFYAVGANPLLDPAPYGRKIGGCTDDLPASSSTWGFGCVRHRYLYGKPLA